MISCILDIIHLLCDLMLIMESAFDFTVCLERCFCEIKPLEVFLRYFYEKSYEEENILAINSNNEYTMYLLRNQFQ